MHEMESDFFLYIYLIQCISGKVTVKSCYQDHLADFNCDTAAMTSREFIQPGTISAWGFTALPTSQFSGENGKAFSANHVFEINSCHGV